MMLLAEPAGRLLERAGDCTPRGMTVLDRTRLIGQLLSGIPDDSDSIKAKAHCPGRKPSAYPRQHKTEKIYFPTALPQPVE
jgi:hypothetical protein